MATKVETPLTANTNINPLWRVWEDQTPIQIPQTNYTLKGFSIAALRTNYYIKELGIMLDAGLSANLSPDYIFVTHGHADHCANLPYHLYSVKPNSQIQIYAPSESVTKFKKLLDSAYELSADTDITTTELPLSNTCYNLIGVDSMSKLQNINIKGKKIDVEIIPCTHSVPCVGYGFTEQRLKLKPEYQKLSGKEIGALRKTGAEINYEMAIPFFCFLGDTSKDILQNPVLEKYQTIMIECTFISDDEIEQANKTMHMHWQSLESYIVAHPNITFILYHFSQRYKRSEIIDFFALKNLPNVITWISV
jgi:ribonuclease Z